MKCIECGHELKDGAIFCIRCGAMQVSMDGQPLEHSQETEWPTVDPQIGSLAPTMEAQPTREFTPAPSGGKGRIALLIVVIIVVVALIAFLAFSCMGPATSGSDSAQSAGTTTATSASSASASTTSASSTSASASASSASASASASSASAATTSAATGANAVAGSTTEQQEPTPEITNEQPQRTVTYDEPQQSQPQSSVGTQTSNAPTPSGSTGSVSYEASSTRYYDRSELESMSVSDLYYARNEVFARHGRMFKRSDLQSYFDSQDWYERKYTPEEWESMPNQLNDYEYKNTLLMREVEADKGSPYL